MSKYFVNITNTAKDDLKDIARYIKNELKEPDVAINLIQKIKKAIYSLDNKPYRNALVRDKDLVRFGYRFLVVGNYIVFYIILEEEQIVDIVRVIYARRNWEKIL
ncbi:MAG: type II toxin-antitoxin system RelE/ParE family toxin [Oscillospiraceae bacterium]|nr:type II toxin-antitoxin system RelE/ParE family toxin [Oscillospiraceae bacterium]